VEVCKGKEASINVLPVPAFEKWPYRLTKNRPLASKMALLSDDDKTLLNIYSIFKYPKLRNLICDLFNVSSSGYIASDDIMNNE
jgi:hypothetical protein